MSFPKCIASLLVAVALFLNGCVTTPAPADQSDYAGFDYVTSVEGVGRDALYDGTKLWIAENFRSAKAVIDFENKEQGIIICNGVLPNIILDTGLVKMPQNASFKMKVEIKDAKMRLSFTQFQIEGRMNASLFKTEVEQMKTRLSTFGVEIARSLSSGRASNF